MRRRGKTGTTGASGRDDMDSAGAPCWGETRAHPVAPDRSRVQRPTAEHWRAAMGELIKVVERRRRLDEDSIAMIARRLGVSTRTVHDRYCEAIRPLVKLGVALSLGDQEAIAASPDRRTAVAVLRRRGRDESAVVLLDAIARCPGRLLMDLRRRDPVGLASARLESLNEVPPHRASQTKPEA